MEAILQHGTKTDMYVSTSQRKSNQKLHLLQFSSSAKITIVLQSHTDSLVIVWVVGINNYASTIVCFNIKVSHFNGKHTLRYCWRLYCSDWDNATTQQLPINDCCRALAGPRGMNWHWRDERWSNYFQNKKCNNCWYVWGLLNFLIQAPWTLWCVQFNNKRGSQEKSCRSLLSFTRQGLRGNTTCIRLI